MFEISVEPRNVNKSSISKVPISCHTVLLDIEGTIAPISFVHDVLFPFARRQLDRFLREHAEDSAITAIRAQISVDAGGQQFDHAGLVNHLYALMDQDAKVTGLKMLQGLIWRQGYESGELRSPLFPDVAPALRRWHSAGIDIPIYSSGSVDAQRLFLAHTTDGDMTPLITAYYDTTTGPKKSADSYRRIAADCAAGRRVTDTDAATRGILFISDVEAELDAAAQAGMQTRLSVRPGNVPISASVHTAIGSFGELVHVSFLPNQAEKKVMIFCRGLTRQ